MKITIMDSVNATAQNNYSTGELQFFPAGARVGSIQVSVNDAFNGTNGTVALEASNDNSVWSTVYADDNVTPMSFTLSGASSNYTWLLKIVAFAYYRIVYTKGNATAGTVKAVMNIN